MGDPARLASVQTLPAGRHGLSREQVAESQRARLLHSMLTLTAERGYAEVTIDEVVRRARTAKRTFYELYPDKLACFLAVYEVGITDLLTTVAEAWEATAPPRERVRSAVRAFVGALAADADLARVCMVDVMAAGPEAATRLAQTKQNFADAIIAWRHEAREHWPELSEMTATAALAVVGAINEPVTMALINGDGDHLLGLVDELSDVVLGMVFGPNAGT